MRGIVLKKTPYREKGWMFTLLVEEKGTCTLFSHPSCHAPGISVFHLVLVHTSIFRGKEYITEIELEDGFSELRSSFDKLRSLDAMCKVLLRVEPTALSFRLFLEILSLMKTSNQPEALETAFYTKLAKIEGFPDTQTFFEYAKGGT